MTDYSSDQDTFIKTDSIKQGYNLTACSQHQHGTKCPNLDFSPKLQVLLAANQAVISFIVIDGWASVENV